MIDQSLSKWRKLGHWVYYDINYLFTLLIILQRSKHFYLILSWHWGIRNFTSGGDDSCTWIYTEIIRVRWINYWIDKIWCRGWQALLLCTELSDRNRTQCIKINLDWRIGLNSLNGSSEFLSGTKVWQLGNLIKI